MIFGVDQIFALVRDFESWKEGSPVQGGRPRVSQGVGKAHYYPKRRIRGLDSKLDERIQSQTYEEALSPQG